MLPEQQMQQQPDGMPQAQGGDVRAYILQLQKSGALDGLSTQQLEQLLSQLRGEPIKGFVLPGGNGLSLQTEEGRNVTTTNDRTAKPAEEERASIAEILNQMRSK